MLTSWFSFIFTAVFAGGASGVSSLLRLIRAAARATPATPEKMWYTLIPKPDFIFQNHFEAKSGFLPAAQRLRLGLTEVWDP